MVLAADPGCLFVSCWIFIVSSPRPIGGDVVTHASQKEGRGGGGDTDISVVTTVAEAMKGRRRTRRRKNACCGGKTPTSAQWVRTLDLRPALGAFVFCPLGLSSRLAWDLDLVLRILVFVWLITRHFFCMRGDGMGWDGSAKRVQYIGGTHYMMMIMGVHYFSDAALLRTNGVCYCWVLLDPCTLQREM